VIVGREQGDNDLRSRTPALARSDHLAAMVDPEEAHARALALYEEGAGFHSAPRAASRALERSTRAPLGSSDAVELASTPTRESSSLSSSLPLFLGVALVLLLLYRGLFRARFTRR
jgi:hypothetical protein